MRRYLLLLSLGILILVLFSCGGPPPIMPSPAPPPVKQIQFDNADSCLEIVAGGRRGFSLTYADLYWALYHSGAQPKGGVMDTAAIRVLLDSIVADTLAGLHAETVDLGQHYSQHRTWRNQCYSILVREFVGREVYAPIDFDSAEVEEFYRSRPDLFAVPEMRLIYHLSTAWSGLRHDPDSMQFAALSDTQLDSVSRVRMENLYDELDGREDFVDLVKASDTMGLVSFKGGFLGWVARGQYLEPFDSVAFLLDSGAISEPYQDQYGWHLLYCDGQMQPGTPPLVDTLFMSAVATLRNVRINERAKELFDSIRGQINLEYHDSVLDTNVYFVPMPTWAAVVNGTDTLDFADLRSLEEAYRKEFNIHNTTVDLKKMMLQELAEKLVVVQAARNLGLHEDTTYTKIRDSLAHIQTKAIVLRDRSGLDWDPPDSIIRAYYDAHIDEFTNDKPLKVQHILVEDSLLGEFLRDQALAGMDFLDLAEEYYVGEPEMRRKLADLGEIGPGDMPEVFYRAAYKTIPGDVSHPVRTELGYHIIYLLERNESKSLGEARSTILSRLKQQHHREVFRAFRERLFTEYEVRTASTLLPMHFRPLEIRGTSEANDSLQIQAN